MHVTTCYANCEFLIHCIFVCLASQASNIRLLTYRIIEQELRKDVHHVCGQFPLVLRVFCSLESLREVSTWLNTSHISRITTANCLCSFKQLTSLRQPAADAYQRSYSMLPWSPPLIHHYFIHTSEPQSCDNGRTLQLRLCNIT